MKRAYIFDFDETLVTTDAKIHIFKNGVYKTDISPKEYNEYKPQRGETFDFSDFDDPDLIFNAKKYKAWPILENIYKSIKEKESISSIYILTARNKAVKFAIYEFLKNNGIIININNILTISNNNLINIPEEKYKRLKYLSQKYDEIIFFDDDIYNLSMAKKIPNVKTYLIENAMGGVSTPMATLNNTPGMGNIVPPGPGTIGSGDNWGLNINKKPFTQGKIKIKRKRKKKKIVKENINTYNFNLILKEKKIYEAANINPYDKLGVAMAKKLKVPLPFKKKKNKKNQNAMIQVNFKNKLVNESLDEFLFEAKKKKKWIQAAFKDIEKRGTEGKCSGDKFGGPSCPPGSRQYNMAKTLRKIAKKRKKK